MIFWIAVLLGAAFAWGAVQIGFYGAWIMFFNLLMSAYMALFLTPVMIESIPAATAIPDYGCAMTTLSIAIATLFISYGICYAFLSGHLRAPFPNVFDNVGAGVMGFLSGFLFCSFMAFTFSLTPISEADWSKSLGLNADSQGTNKAYLGWWCDTIHSFVSARSAQPIRSHGTMEILLGKARPKPVVAPTVATTSPAPTSDLGEASTAAAPDSDKTGATEEATKQPESEGMAVGETTGSGQPMPSETRGANATPETAPLATPGAKAAAAAAPEEKSGGWADEAAMEARSSTSVKSPQATVSSGQADAARSTAPSNVRRPLTKGAMPSAETRSAASPSTVPATPTVVGGAPATSPGTTAAEGMESAERSAPPPEEQGPLTGYWQGTHGVVLHIADDGTSAIVKLTGRNELLQFMAGKLTRADGKADAKKLTGTLDTIFVPDARQKQMPIRVEATIGDAGQLTLHLANWPKWFRGRVAERSAMTEILMKVEQPRPFFGRLRPGVVVPEGSGMPAASPATSDAAPAPTPATQ